MGKSIARSLAMHFTAESLPGMRSPPGKAQPKVSRTNIPRT